jgi:hypothetical protein
MAVPNPGSKLYDLFTLMGASFHCRNCVWRMSGNTHMVGLALAMFIALFGWGAGYFGWHDPVGKVQLALFTSFILGAVAGYKSRG